jgi:hypothetical protein
VEEKAMAKIGDFGGSYKAQAELRRHLSMFHMQPNTRPFNELVYEHDVQHEIHPMTDEHRRLHFQMKLAVEMEAQVSGEDQKAKRENTNITYHELSTALKQLNYYHYALDASRIVDKVLENREPDYPNGSIWKDKHGHFYYRSRSEWLTFGTAKPYPDDIPVRPLTRVDQ